jgi:hypothetical protein
LDGAWNAGEIGFPTLDFRSTGPGLRYISNQADLDEFNRELPKSLSRFILYGSGDFHHLAALWLRRAIESDASGDRVTLISFDNHPDWDIRPPRWACGGWINRALELPAVYQAHVWGCGNFELAWPHRLFANRRALKSGKLNVHAWSERQPESVRRLFNCMTRESWRDRWLHVIASLPTKKAYVTIDLDCLTSSAAQTNWESGLFTAEDVAWAINALRGRGSVRGLVANRGDGRVSKAGHLVGSSAHTPTCGEGCRIDQSVVSKNNLAGLVRRRPNHGIMRPP